jgi:predicted RNA-binding protein YlxR (DUF448 family)
MVTARTKLMPDVATRSGLRPRRVPQRTCVGCGSVTAKRELIRIVRGLDGVVRPDPTGKAAGRGAYLHADRSCWEAGLKKKLERSLNVAISPEGREALVAYAQGLPEEAPA